VFVHQQIVFFLFSAVTSVGRHSDNAPDVDHVQKHIGRPSDNVPDVDHDQTHIERPSDNAPDVDHDQTHTGRPSDNVPDVDHVRTHAEHGRVKNFGQHESSNDTNVSDAITKKGRAYTPWQLNNKESIRTEIHTSCERIPAANMTRFKYLFHSIPLYVERRVTVTDEMIDQAKQLAWILIGLAKYIFKIPVKWIHLFRDIDGGSHM
jgi:hypothetical protein